MSDTSEFTIFKEVTFNCKRLAEIAYHVLRVDNEPTRARVQKYLNVSNNLLIGEFRGDIKTRKHVETTANNFLENVKLIKNTMDFAGPPNFDDLYSIF